MYEGPYHQGGYSQGQQYLREKEAIKKRDANNKIAMVVFGVLFILCCGGGWYMAKSKSDNNISNNNSNFNNDATRHQTKNTPPQPKPKPKPADPIPPISPEKKKEAGETKSSPEQPQQKEQQPPPPEQIMKKVDEPKILPQEPIKLGTKKKSKFMVGESIKKTASQLKATEGVAEVHSKSCRDDLEIGGFVQKQCTRSCKAFEREDEIHSSCMLGCGKAGNAAVSRGCEGSHVTVSHCADTVINNCDSHCSELPSSFCTEGCRDVARHACESAMDVLKTVLTAASESPEF
jgi:hypothetical protein